MPHRIITSLGTVLLAAVSVVATGCDEDTGGPSSDPVDTVSHRNSRYCEVIPVYLGVGELRADVWNTRPFNDCPQEAWDALDAAAIQEDLGAVRVIMNGPRYFLMDDTAFVRATSPPTYTFGTLRMARLATFTLPLTTSQQEPYVERVIARDTQFWFWEGSEIYELLAPDDAAYVMQSYALIVDPTLDVMDLAGLGARLQLPAGWTYNVRVLTEPLEVSTVDGSAVVIQDELQNTYQRYHSP